jgi:hypothetical protein
MADTLHTQMHVDHTHWLDEASFWKQDIAMWKGEVEGALADIERLADALASHAEALQTHLDAIGHQELDLRKHEHALAEYEQGAAGGELISQAKAHAYESNSQMAAREVHERIKRFHHVLIARWNLLCKAVCSPM